MDYEAQIHLPLSLEGMNVKTSKQYTLNVVLMVADHSNHTAAIVDFEMEEFTNSDTEEESFYKGEFSFAVLSRDSLTGQYTEKALVKSSLHLRSIGLFDTHELTSQEFHHQNILLTKDLLICRLGSIKDLCCVVWDTKRQKSELRPTLCWSANIQEEYLQWFTASAYVCNRSNHQ